MKLPAQDSIKKGIILSSGGLNSSTVMELMKKENYEIYSLSVDYGQWDEIDISTSFHLASLETDVKEHKIIKCDLNHLVMEPNTYIPGRNLIFLSLALAWADIIKCFDIFIGVSAGDLTDSPDYRPEFIKKFENICQYATKLGATGVRETTINTPLIDMGKSEILKLRESLNIKNFEQE